LLPAGAFAGWDSHPLESAALSRRTGIADDTIEEGAAEPRIPDDLDTICRQAAGLVVRTKRLVVVFDHLEEIAMVVGTPASIVERDEIAARASAAAWRSGRRQARAVNRSRTR